MKNGKPFSNLFNSPITPKILTKIILGVSLFVFFLDYQPALGIPPVKSNTVRAQVEQSTNIQAQAIPIGFQIPHPGYISTHYSNYHPAIDLAAGLGIPVKPIAPGTVVETGFNFWGLGLIVRVDHGYGYKSLYAHLGKIYVQNGQQINADNFLGEVGLTGNTSGPHTHIEIYKDGASMDPLALLPKMREIPLAEDFKPVGGKLNQPALKPQPNQPKVETIKEPDSQSNNQTLNNLLGKDIDKAKDDPLKEIKIGI